jgi:hypothetical protein
VEHLSKHLSRVLVYSWTAGMKTDRVIAWVIGEKWKWTVKILKGNRIAQLILLRTELSVPICSYKSILFHASTLPALLRRQTFTTAVGTRARASRGWEENKRPVLWGASAARSCS